MNYWWYMLVLGVGALLLFLGLGLAGMDFWERMLIYFGVILLMWANIGYYDSNRKK